MKKLIWVIIVAFGLASLPFGGTAFAGQGQGGHRHKTVAHAGKVGKVGKVGKAGKAGKHHGKKHHAKHAGKPGKNKNK